MKLSFAKRISTADDDIKALEKTQKYWERSAADAQGNLRDILGGPRTM
jgi:prefoldin subunit 1